ncbi:MAG: diaminopimelate decarboxylase [Gammaproteobacteria bacterium]|nr:diaminopimelate decarboxylase [Gammaproteobacteria bacterium]
MQAFAYTNGQLCAEEVALAEVASRFGTPCYVYSRTAIEQQWQEFNSALGQGDHLICYAVKANSNIAILNLLARLGSGFDIVSVGELERVLRAGGDAGKTVFSGVGKRVDEMRRALEAGIKCFNAESVAELERLNSMARGINRIAPVSIRVNPDIDVDTHPYIATGLKENKFGIPYADALPVYELAASLDSIKIIGIGCHIGSQITVMDPFINALERLLSLTAEIENKGITLQHIDVGGGLGICYQDETPPTAKDYVKELMRIFSGKSYHLILEPGRSIVGNAGVLLTRVEYLKQTSHKNFAVVDAAMNDQLRPALYGAWHNILPLTERTAGQGRVYDIVGPVCETSDFLGKDRKLLLHQGDVLAICSAGAYGFCMSSTYNSRTRACEVMVDGRTMHEIRRRETLEELMTGESLLPA